MRAMMAAALASGLLFCLGATANAADCAETAKDGLLVYVGTDGTQLRAASLKHCALQMIGPVAELAKPRWAIASPKQDRLYVAGDGQVSAFNVDRKTGALNAINTAPAGGAGTTFLALDAPSPTLLTANFGAGSAASVAVKADGSLGDPVSTISATGFGPHRRQASAHAHGVSLDPTGRYALVADFGADRVFVYGFDRKTHALSRLDKDGEFATPPGSGPRRAVFGASGRFVYVLNELTAELMVLRWDAPKLSVMQTLPLSAPEFTGTRSGAELAVSRDGRFLYAINRGENTLQVYAVDGKTGELALVQRIASGGEAPWAFDISPSGRSLLVANYRSNRLNLFAIDAATGRLTDSGQALDSPAPVSVTFVMMNLE